MDLTAYVLLLVSIGLGVAGQLCLKHGMSKRPGFSLAEIWQVALDIYVVSGFLCYGLSVLLYLKALANLDLSLAYPTVSLGYVVVILFSKLFFDERISAARWVAVVIICAGVALVGLGS